MRIVKYLESGQIHIGDITVEGRTKRVIVSCPDTDPRLTYFLNEVARTKSVLVSFDVLH